MSMPLARASSSTLGKRPISKLKAEDVHAGDVLLAAFQDDFFDVEARHGRLTGPTDTSRRPFALEGLEAVGLFGAIGAQD